MVDVGVVSYGAGAALFGLLTLLLLTRRPGRRQGALLLAAVGVSALWAAASAVHAGTGVPPYPVLALLEVGRDAAWFVFLLGVLGQAGAGDTRPRLELRWARRVIVGLCAVTAALTLAGPVLPAGASLPLFGHLLLAVAGLALVEQLYRSTPPEQRWSVKFLCLGVGGVFAYDLYLYSDSLLFKSLDAALWDARGAVHVIVAPLVAVSAARNPQWKLDIFVSRHVVLHSVAVLGAGIYLLLMAGAAYYIRLYGGTWGGAAQAAFLFGAIILLGVLLSSGRLRSRTRVFLAKHFFRNKYDYREEWLRFAHRLSTSAHDQELRQNVVRGIAEIVESPGGLMWVRTDGEAFRCTAGWNAAPPEEGALGADAPLVRFLEDRGWVVYLEELASEPGRYPALVLPTWLERMRDAWIVVPLMQRDELLGLVVLLRSGTMRQLDWEDTDVLKTVGREAASYLAVLKLSDALADARQFEAFNRLSAYIVHDLKNLVAQLSLVVSNARRHRDNREFMEDAINTVENATEKMKRLLAHLRQQRAEPVPIRRVALAPLLQDVVKACGGEQPQPALECGEEVAVNADRDRLLTVIQHLVQNAQEATPDDGGVWVRLHRDGDWAVVDVEDTGAGMDARFVAERLFRPFDTTKGNAGMGIGAYETREFTRALGGDVKVESEPGAGTRFRLRLPAAAEQRSPGDPGVEVAS